MRSTGSVWLILTLGASAVAAAPATPPGLEPCAAPMLPARGPVGSPGERFLYRVELLGLELGTVTVATTRRGRFAGQAVTEYRAWMDSEPVLRKLLGVDGDLSALVPDDGFTPLASRLAYSYRGDRYVELQTYSEDGRVSATRTKNGKTSLHERQLGVPVLDILTALQLVRRLPEGARGCAILFSDGRPFTAWLEPKGPETLRLEDAAVDSERYSVRYGSDKAGAKVQALDLWVGADRRLLRARSHARLSPVFSLRRGRG